MQYVLVVAAGRYDFTNDRGQQVAGTKLTLAQFPPPSAPDDTDHRGMLITTASVPFGAFAQFDRLPAVYGVQWDNVPTRNGKMRSVLTEIVRIADADAALRDMLTPEK